MLIDKKKNLFFLLALVVGALLSLPAAWAQETGATPVSETEVEAESEAPQIPDFDTLGLFDTSLLLSPFERQLIYEALQGVGQTEIPEETKEEEFVDLPVLMPERRTLRAPRLIKVAGLLYRDTDDWVVWINGARMTPYQVLPEIREIKVERDRIHLKWYNAITNEILSISLRPHQTYDILTGILLPG